MPEKLLKYADSYRKNHGLASRSEVLAQALKMLREAELAQGYKNLAAEYREQRLCLVQLALMGSSRTTRRTGNALKTW